MTAETVDCQEACKVLSQIGQSPLHEVAFAERSFVNAAGGTGYTPLHYAARAGRLDAARLLLEHGNSSTYSVITPLPIYLYQILRN